MSRVLGRRLICRVLALGGASLLGGCGFQPVYMKTASGKAGPAQREMAQVNVPVIPDRPGQLLRQALQRELGSDSGAPATYDLLVAYGISGEGISIQANNISTRVRMIGTASWRLVERNPQQTLVTSGSARSMDGLNVFNEQYFAADMETEAVQKRIANAVAQQIALQLAVWFRQQAAKQAG
ncbi:LPS assembly lipoprotein LptE [Rhodopila sp.]|jgi:LPS-assembly lipoprotein|uniref:LPS assembly lipoprotein LptE n=1 Tax=Rhodopila sp. TaxID=2480087 RepID=UPI002BA23F2F|nr:LPS assembly lipoprotein LptE [Rhodopila sp.]HVZ09294.1 LPS assembly lipoprotein LptE [Rhodopila sp.]